jgi:hypothetical protein
VYETAEDPAELQELLDRTFSRMNPHMAAIVKPERRLSAQQVVTYLQGIKHVAFATVNERGEPRVAPLDGIFLRGFSDHLHHPVRRHVRAGRRRRLLPHDRHRPRPVRPLRRATGASRPGDVIVVGERPDPLWRVGGRTRVAAVPGGVRRSSRRLHLAYAALGDREILRGSIGVAVTPGATISRRFTRAL